VQRVQTNWLPGLRVHRMGKAKKQRHPKNEKVLPSMDPQDVKARMVGHPGGHDGMGRNGRESVCHGGKPRYGSSIVHLKTFLPTQLDSVH